MNVELVLAKLAAKRDEKIAAANAEYEQVASALRGVMGETDDPPETKIIPTWMLRDWIARHDGDFTTTDLRRAFPMYTDKNALMCLASNLLKHGEVERVSAGLGRVMPGVYRRKNLKGVNGKHAKANGYANV